MESLLIVDLALYCVLRKIERRAKKAKTADCYFPVRVLPDQQAEFLALTHSVEEQMAVINNTKDLEAAIRSFAVIRRDISKLSSLTRYLTRVSIIIGEKEICRELDLTSGSIGDTLDDLESEWMKGFFTERADRLSEQAEATADPVLKVDFVREALKTLLQGLEYLPGDETLKAHAAITEQRLADLSGSQ